MSDDQTCTLEAAQYTGCLKGPQKYAFCNEMATGSTELVTDGFDPRPKHLCHGDKFVEMKSGVLIDLKCDSKLSYTITMKDDIPHWIESVFWEYPESIDSWGWHGDYFVRSYQLQYKQYPSQTTWSLYRPGVNQQQEYLNTNIVDGNTGLLETKLIPFIAYKIQLTFNFVADDSYGQERHTWTIANNLQCVLVFNFDFKVRLAKQGYYGERLMEELGAEFTKNYTPFDWGTDPKLSSNSGICFWFQTDNGDCDSNAKPHFTLTLGKPIVVNALLYGLRKDFTYSYNNAFYIEYEFNGVVSRYEDSSGAKEFNTIFDSVLWSNRDEQYEFYLDPPVIADKVHLYFIEHNGFYSTLTDGTVYHSNCYSCLRFDFLVYELDTIIQDTTTIDDCSDPIHFYSTAPKFPNFFEIVDINDAKFLRVKTPEEQNTKLFLRSTHPTSGTSYKSDRFDVTVTAETYTAQSLVTKNIFTLDFYAVNYWVQLKNYGSIYDTSGFTDKIIHFNFKLFRDVAFSDPLTIGTDYYTYTSDLPIYIQPITYPNSTAGGSVLREFYYDFKYETSTVILRHFQGKITTTICEVNLWGAIVKQREGQTAKTGEAAFTLDESLLSTINVGRTCPSFSHSTGRMKVVSLYEEDGSKELSLDKVSVSSDKTQILFNLDTAKDYFFQVRYNFEIADTRKADLVGQLPLYGFFLKFAVCETFEEIIKTFEAPTQMVTLDDINTSLLDSVNLMCTPEATTIKLADDEIGTTTTLAGISLNAAGKLQVDSALIPDAIVSFYLYGQTDKFETNINRVRKISIAKSICDQNPFNAFLAAQIPLQAKSIFESKTKSETLTWTPQEFLAFSQIAQDFGSACQLEYESLKFSSITQNSQAYSNPGLYLDSSGSLVLKKSLAGNHKVDISFELSSQKFIAPFTALICGVEQISAKSGYQLIQIELEEGDQGKEYFTKYSQMLETSIAQCNIKEESFELVNQDGGSLGRTTGKDYVKLDLEKKELYIDKAKAIPSSFSAYLVAETIGGVKGGNYQFMFKITKKVNQAPQFKQKIENQAITVLQKDQLVEGLGTFQMQSPKIEDPEGHQISIKASGYEQINGLTFTPDYDSFSIKIDLQKLSIDDAGSHEITVVLGDNGPIPKEDENQETFVLEIQYLEMDPEELQDLKDFGDIDVEGDGEGTQGSMGELSEGEVTNGEVNALPALPIVKGESVKERKQRIKNLREQTKKVGYTFPGVSQEQIDAFERNKEKEIIVPLPQINIDSVNVLGEVKISFNQEMLIPADISMFDYSAAMKFKLVSTASGKMTYAEKAKKRNLQQSDNDLCQGKQLSQMTLQEKMNYYMSLDYDQEDYLAKCEIVQKRNAEVEGSSKEESSSKKSSNAFTWQVLNHTKEEINIKLDFAEPGEISSTSQGRDQLVIELLDVRIFKSALTGESIKETDFQGMPQISMEIPPIIENMETVEQIKGSTDMISKITTFLSSANFAVGIILGGSMQQLYGLIRAMQMILLCLLTDVAYPAPTFVFFQGAILFAGMDIFSGEDFFEKHLVFKDTTPINMRFQEFGIENKNFMLNSGSYLIMQVFIVLWLCAKVLIRKICVKFSKYSIFRNIGMIVGESDLKQLRDASMRLLMESYFDISIVTMINLIAFKESESLQDFASFFSTPTDALCSVITIIMFFAIFWFPAWIYKKIHSNRENLKDPEFQKELAWLFEGYRATEYNVALQQFYFLTRRLYLAIILTWLPNESILHCCSFIMLSCLNLVNLHWNEPFLKSKDLRIEIFNEWCIFICCAQILSLLDPKTPAATRLSIGWGLIYIVSLNIGVNLIIVSQTVFCDIWNSIEEQYLAYDEWVNRNKIINNYQISKEQRMKANKEFKDYEYCSRWAEHRKWLREQEIEFSTFPEEIKFQEIIHENDYLERAKNIQIIVASQSVAEKMKQKKIMEKIVKKFKHKSKSLKNKRAKNPHQVQLQKKLDTIQEISLSNCSESDYLDKIETHGILQGLDGDTTLYKKMNKDRLFTNDHHKVQVQQLDFVFDDAVQERQKVEEQIIQRINLDRSERYAQEFSQNEGIKCLIDGRQKHVISSVLQCLIAIPEFVKFFLVKEQNMPVSKTLQKIFTGVFQHSYVKYNEMRIEELARHLQGKRKAHEVYTKLLDLLKMELEPEGDEKVAEIIISKTFEGQFCEHLSCSKHKKEFQKLCSRNMLTLGNFKTIEDSLQHYFQPKSVKIDCVHCEGHSEGSQRLEITHFADILVLKINGSSISWQIDLDDAEYHLFAIVCKDVNGLFYSIVKKFKKWYVFKPSPQQIEKEKVFFICQNIQMIFYSKQEEKNQKENSSNSDDDSY